MVTFSSPSLNPGATHPYRLTIVIMIESTQAQETLLAALKPEFPAIDSKRVMLQVKPSRNQLVFHLATKDITALRAATTSLTRLYLVADGVYQLTVKKNG